MAKKKFYTTSPVSESHVNGLVYVLLIDLEDKTLVKIGVTSRLKIQDRVCEILSSIFISYRCFPYCYPKKFSRTTDIYEKEAALHYHFSNYYYKCASSWSGSTEVFDVDDIDYLCEIYERCLAGEDIRLLDKYVKEDISISPV